MLIFLDSTSMYNRGIDDFLWMINRWMNVLPTENNNFELLNHGFVLNGTHSYPTYLPLKLYE